MLPPPLIYYSSEKEYQLHFESVYCKGVINTFDGIPVYFKKERFFHCMYESSHKNNQKDQFSLKRAQRIDWIKATLENPNADLYQGWDSKQRRIEPSRRVAVVYESYVVVIHVSNRNGKINGEFITSFYADNSIAKITQMPRWGKK